MLPILPIVVVVASGVYSFDQHVWLSTPTAVVASLAAAGVFGVPAMYWTLDHGHRRLLPLLLVGTVASLAPLLVVVSSGVVGLLARGGTDGAMRILKTGAPIPGLGVMPWPAFGEAELRAAIIGTVSATTYWMIFVVPKAAARWRSS